MALIGIAGVVHLAIAGGNVLLPRLLDYRRQLAALDPLIRQVYLVHSLYIVLVLTALGVLCLAFPADLAGSSDLGRTLSAGIAIFWGIRLLLHLFYYRPAATPLVRAMARALLVCVVGFVALFTALACGAAT
ncbi:MAG TPA: hypothetical protein VEL07_05675 [Planctomycetota bacterium]|nr:hypothetical protein [Planctomycetota bacterium]